jgi:S-DNA-T family DNA segregation ATPase FtsK/SpoIIIE
MAAVTRNPALLSFALLTPAMAVWSHVESRRGGARRRGDEVAEFRREVGDLGVRVREARLAETDRRRDAAPDAVTLRGWAGTLAPRLWERRPQDPDFLELRVGTGDLQPTARVAPGPGGAAELRDEALSALQPDVRLPAVPVTVKLAGGVLGLAGPEAAVAALARLLVVQAAVLHSPAELEVAVVLADADADWEWAKWLPHARHGALVVGSTAGRELCDGLAAEGRPALVVIDGTLRIEPALLARVATAGGGVIWLGRDVRGLPGTCTHVAELEPDRSTLRVVDVAAGAEVPDVSAEGMAADAAEEVARLLAPIDDEGAEEASEAVPSRVSLLELLELPDPTGAAVAQRWLEHGDRLIAPIGAAADGPFEVDVGRTEGLRMLLAGMPGAGKSELLQALIASLAALHPPDRLTFLFVDYKGGAAFRDAVELPHAVGLVTDLDQHLAERARASLLAELRRREALLERNGVRSLRELRSTRRDAAPPDLLIVVDEFATLVREVPSFVETVVDVAQRGRSLGLHLILATQRPRGAVGDAIRANTNLRIAMRVADRGESEDVIEAADAAAIRADAPGRAIALIGRKADGSPSLTTFQAAYAGGRTAARPLAAVRVTALDDRGGHSASERVLSQVDGALPTDLQLLVRASRAAAEQLEIEPPDAPWLPALPSTITPDDLEVPIHGGVPIGVVDEPALQRRRMLIADLEHDGSLLVYGASGSGKTVLLQSLARALAASGPPSAIQIYGLDFASGALGAIRSLPHCGAVVRGDEGERVLRLLAMLRRALRDRKAAGETGHEPRIVLLVDGYGAFASAYERVDFGEPVALLARIAAEGRPLGLHVVVTADRRADVPGALAGVVPVRLVLRLADPEELVTLGVPRSATHAELPAGRGFTQDATEFQVALPGDLEAFGEELRARDPERAPAVGVLPTHVSRTDLPSPSGPLQAVLGLDDELLAPTAVDLAEGSFLVVGPHRTGRTTTLAAIAESIRRGTPDAALWLLAPRRTALTGLGLWTGVAAGLDDCAAAAEQLVAAPQEPLIVFVDDAVELGEGQAAAALEAVLRRGRDAPVRVVAAADPHGLQRLFGGWLRDLRVEGRGLLLSPSADADADILGVRLPRGAGAALPPGRGYLALRGVARLVQVAGT